MCIYLDIRLIENRLEACRLPDNVLVLLFNTLINIVDYPILVTSINMEHARNTLQTITLNCHTDEHTYIRSVLNQIFI